MKKLLFIGLAVTAMLVSCSNDETVEMAQQSAAISFNGFVNKSTRVTEDITLANLGSIEVYGWRGDVQGDVQIFDKQAVTVGTDGKGSYNPLQYWEAGYTYAFEAIAPKDAEGVTFAAAKTGGTITFENNAETDLLYSKAADVTTPASIASVSPVPFTFKHLLSRVKFTFVNGFPEDAIAKISVKDVQISNASKNGTITPAATDAAWTATDNDLEVKFANVDATNIAAGNEQGGTEHMYLIPVASPSYTVTFTVTLAQGTATTEYKHTVTIATEMKQGLSYNFVATLNQKNVDPESEMYPIEFTAEVSPWGAFPETGTEILPAPVAP